MTEKAEKVIDGVRYRRELGFGVVEKQAMQKLQHMLKDDYRIVFEEQCCAAVYQRVDD